MGDGVTVTSLCNGADHANERGTREQIERLPEDPVDLRGVVSLQGESGVIGQLLIE